MGSVLSFERHGGKNGNKGDSSGHRTRLENSCHWFEGAQAAKQECGPHLIWQLANPRFSKYCWW